MADVVEFLRARLDEDEAEARRGAAARFPVADFSMYYNADDEVMVATCARVLREVEAKRRMLDEVVDQIDGFDADLEMSRGTGGYRTTGESDLLKHLLASAYSDHPDYDPSWAPSPASASG
jgi:hypothetical protein